MNQEANAVIVRIRQEKAAVHRRLAMLDAAEEVILGLEGAPPLDLPGIASPERAERMALAAQHEMTGALSLDQRAAQAASDAAILRNKVKAQKAAGKERKKRRKNIQTSGGCKVRRGTKNPFSPYEGVYNGGVNARGQQRYLANIWREGKNKGLGTFYIPEEAAAAVQKAKGNKAEAKRLSEIARQKAADMAESAENNPDREPRSRKQKTGAVLSLSKQDAKRKARKGRKPATRRTDPADPAEPGESELARLGGLPPADHVALAWVCNKCGHNHLQAEKPKVCENCFENHGFHELK